MANEYYLDHVGFIIGRGEGSIGISDGVYYIKYDTIEKGSPFEGIGMLQWSMGRSFDLLHDIYVRLGNNFGGTTPPANIQTAIENNQRWDSYKWYQYSDDTNWVREFLTLDEGKAVQNEKYIEEIQGYLDKLESQGVTDLKARAFCADISNQYGTGWGTTFGGARFNSEHNTLDLAYAFAPKKYLTRRNNCYDYLNTADFDQPAPVTYNIAGATIPEENSASGDLPPEPTLDENQTEITTSVLKKLSTNYLTKSGNTYYNENFKLIPVSGFTSNPTNFLLNPTYDIYKILLENSDLVEEEVQIIDENTETNKNENASTEIADISNLSEAIQKAVAKALSYPDNSVLYSMTGARDMVSSGDCSCFTDLCYREAGVNLGGWSGAQFNTCKSLGKVIHDGDRSLLQNIINDAQIGDLVLMGQSGSTYVAGGASHVGIIVGNNQFRHQSASGGITGTKGYGPTTDPLDQYLTNYVAGYQHLSLCRPLS